MVGVNVRENRMNATIRRAGRYALALALVAMPLPMSQATTVSIETSITRTLASADGTFGGCMAALDVAPADSGLNCPVGSKWVTFSCTGEHATEADGLRMYDSAQLAFVTGRRVRVWVDDTRKHDGHCFASRIDVLGS